MLHGRAAMPVTAGINFEDEQRPERRIRLHRRDIRDVVRIGSGGTARRLIRCVVSSPLPERKGLLFKYFEARTVTSRSVRRWSPPVPGQIGAIGGLAPGSAVRGWADKEASAAPVSAWGWCRRADLHNRCQQVCFGACTSRIRLPDRVSSMCLGDRWSAHSAFRRERAGWSAPGGSGRGGCANAL